jgi:outer membrane receptor protein involved in Fe transport
VFRGDSRDDIAFVSSGASTSQGYFRNVDATRRAGLELSASAVHRRLSWRSSYTLVEATFQDDLVLASPNHPHARDGELDVASGDRLPGVPRHQLRASIDTGLAARVGVGAGVRYDSSRFLRGDEANLLAPVPGFWLVDLSLRITLGRAVELRVALDNVLDAEIETFGTLGEADEVLDDDVLGVGGVDFEDPRFVTPGEPRSLTFMLRVGWDRAPRRPGP